MGRPEIALQDRPCNPMSGLCTMKSTQIRTTNSRDKGKWKNRRKGGKLSLESPLPTHHCAFWHPKETTPRRILEAPPVFSQPVKIPRTDPKYLASLELTERARLTTVNVEEEDAQPVPNTENETATKHLQDILDGMTRCHAT